MSDNDEINQLPDSHHLKDFVIVSNNEGNIRSAALTAARMGLVVDPVRVETGIRGDFLNLTNLFRHYARLLAVPEGYSGMQLSVRQGRDCLSSLGAQRDLRSGHMLSRGCSGGGHQVIVTLGHEWISACDRYRGLDPELKFMLSCMTGSDDPNAQSSLYERCRKVDAFLKYDHPL